MILSLRAQLLTMAMVIVTTTPLVAQYDGRMDRGPRDMEEYSRQTGGYCDRGGCPDQFWRYRIYYGPVFYHGRWFRGPVYVKDDNGRNLFWVAGGWHRDEWRSGRPVWARNGHFGPPQSREYYRANFGEGARYGDSGRQPRDWQDARNDQNYRDNQPQDRRQGQGHGDNQLYSTDNGRPRSDAYAQDRQDYGAQNGRPDNGIQDRGQTQEQYQGRRGDGQGQQSQYGNGQNAPGGGWNNGGRQANGGPTNFTNQTPGPDSILPGARRSGQDVARAQGQPTSISVTTATYGGSCKAPKGNVTQPLQTACNGKASCQYTVSVSVLGDPARGCPSDFAVEWTCGTGPGSSASLPAEANGNKITLSCPTGVR
jgi:hypothetical protein